MKGELWETSHPGRISGASQGVFRPGRSCTLNLNINPRTSENWCKLWFWIFSADIRPIGWRSPWRCYLCWWLYISPVYHFVCPNQDPHPYRKLCTLWIRGMISKMENFDLFSVIDSIFLRLHRPFLTGIWFPTVSTSTTVSLRQGMNQFQLGQRVWMRSPQTVNRPV